MVKRILLFFGKLGREITGLHEAAYLIALGSTVSLLFALVRDRLLAGTLGAGSTLDIYYAAFRIPDFIFVTVASLVSTSVLVPFLIDSQKKSREELRASIQSLFSAFFVVILVVCGIVWLFMPKLLLWLYPNIFTLGFGDTLISLSRILLLSPVILGFSSFFTSLTQIGNRFLVYAIGSPLYNIGIITGILWFLPNFGVRGLGFGVVLGAGLLVLSQIPFVIKDGLFPRLTFFKIDWSRVLRVAIVAIPRTITISSQQITMLFLVAFASLLSVGSISIFNLAWNLQSVPLSIIGASYASAVFPVLAKFFAEKNREAFFEKIVSATRHIFFWSIPLSVLFIVLSSQIVRSILGSGKFSSGDVSLTATALSLFVVSSIGQCLILLFVRAFYAEGKTTKPLVINVISAIVTIILGYIFIRIYPSVLMLPLAFSIGTLLNLFLHWKKFSIEFPGFTRSVLRTVFESLTASIIGGYITYKAVYFLSGIFDTTKSIGVFMEGLFAGVIGSVFIVLVLYLLGSRELGSIFDRYLKIGPKTRNLME